MMGPTAGSDFSSLNITMPDSMVPPLPPPFTAPHRVA